MLGPFFASSNPGETMLANMEKMFEALAAEGAKAAQSNMLVNSGARALVRMTNDRAAEHVIGRTRSLAGRQWVSAAVIGISVQGLDAVQSRSLMAAASSVEKRNGAFRKVASSIRSSRAVLGANLAAGLE
jgi:hypothetical protein